jgi:ABC-type transporter Mla maintaining outer membrane lipid asymmetry ATPase subunit MlaF
MAGIVELKNVSFSAQDRLIIDNFSYGFEEGKTTALVGPSGSGKSTVLKLAAGLLVPNTGEVYFRGMEVHHMNRQENLAFRREASVVFQDSALWANQNIYQILELPLRIHFPELPVTERKRRIQDELRKVGYRRDISIRPSQLSMGEQKLIGFARAQMCGPTLLFLDEWTESLDDSGVNRLIKLVELHQKEKNTVIFVCHDFRIVKALANYILMMMDGKFSSLFTREQIEDDESLAQHIEEGIAS